MGRWAPRTVLPSMARTWRCSWAGTPSGAGVWESWAWTQARIAASTASGSRSDRTRRMVQACGTIAPTPSPVEDAAAGVVGVLADRGERACPGQHRARPQQQYRRHTVASPARFPRVGNLTEHLDQRQRHRRDGLRVEADLRMIEGGNDRGHLHSGHGLPDVIKDLDTLMITSSPCPSWYPLACVAAGQLPLTATLPRP